jgi:alkaline phosphatase D
MNWVETPNFDYIEKMGVKADGLIPVFPSLTFPNHYSIATGTYSGTHNITGNSFYDKGLKQKYSLYDRNAVRDARFYKSEPIWVTAERQGVKSASFFWVGTEAPIKGMSPSIFKYYDGDIPFETRVDSVIFWFQLEEQQRPQLILLYFSEPDHTESVTNMDNLLGYLLQELKRLNIYPKLNIVITSDHGMADVSADSLIILDDYISRMEDLYSIGRGSLVQFDYKEEIADYTDVFFQELSTIPHSQTWRKSEIPERFHFINNNTGDYLLLADEGWFITTHSALKENEFTLGGMHGYDPALPNMHGIFYAIGPGLKPGLQIKSFENIHIYPLICELLKIKPYSGMDDAPDGDLQVLQHVLQN